MKPPMQWATRRNAARVTDDVLAWVNLRVTWRSGLKDSETCNYLTLWTALETNPAWADILPGLIREWYIVLVGVLFNVLCFVDLEPMLPTPLYTPPSSTTLQFGTDEHNYLVSHCPQLSLDRWTMGFYHAGWSGQLVEASVDKYPRNCTLVEIVLS